MIREFDHIHEAAAPWASLDPSGSLMTTPEWLATAEEDRSAEVRYLLHYESASEPPTAGLAAYYTDSSEFAMYDPVSQLWTEPSDPTVPEDVTGPLRALQSQLLSQREALYPCAVSMLPGAYLPGTISRDGRAGALEPLLARLEELGRGWGGSLSAVMHVPQEDRQLRELLASRGYDSMCTVAQTELSIEWRSFDQYLMSLHAGRRAGVRREMRKFEQLGFTVRTAGIEEVGFKMASLQTEQLQRYGHPVFLERMEQLVQRIKRHLRRWAHILVAERDGTMEGFVLSYEKAGQLYPKMTGFTEAATAGFAYFNLLYYAQIEYALQHDLKVIVFGPETYEAKVARGCALRPRFTYIRFPAHQRAALKQLAKHVQAYHQARFVHAFRYASHDAGRQAINDLAVLA